MNVFAAVSMDLKKKVMAYLPVAGERPFLEQVRNHGKPHRCICGIERGVTCCQGGFTVCEVKRKLICQKCKPDVLPCDTPVGAMCFECFDAWVEISE